MQTVRAVRLVRTPEESKRLNEDRTPKVIIAGSGMATGGRVVHHLKTFAPDPLNAIVLVGFQAPRTRGASLAEGASQVKIHGEQVPVRAEVVTLHGLSAHADSNELMAWLGGMPQKPRAVFVTHGEPDQSTSLAARIQAELGWVARPPVLGATEELDRDLPASAGLSPATSTPAT